MCLICFTDWMLNTNWKAEPKKYIFLCIDFSIMYTYFSFYKKKNKNHTSHNIIIVSLPSLRGNMREKRYFGNDDNFLFMLLLISEWICFLCVAPWVIRSFTLILHISPDLILVLRLFNAAFSVYIEQLKGFSLD